MVVQLHSDPSQATLTISLRIAICIKVLLTKLLVSLLETQMLVANATGQEAQLVVHLHHDSSQPTLSHLLH